MAQQPNSYKKFVATAATATLVASALVPVAASAASTFTDVPASYTDAVDYLVSKGANGLSATKFGISNEIKRGDAAVLLAGALGLADEKAPASGFSDVPARAATAINSLKAAGIINGKTATSFGYGDNLKRGEVALILAKAYELKGDASKLAFTDVNDRYADAVAALVEAKVTSGVSATKFGTDNNIKRGDFAKFAFALKAPVVTTATKVETVSATNLKEVLVTFDGTVDEDTATDKANYSLKSGKAIKSVALAADGKTVTITVVGTLANNKVDAVSLSNVKAGDKTIDAKNVEFTTVDNVLPEVKEIKSLGTKSVKVSFSEPVEDLKQTNFTLDGKAYFGNVVMGAGNKSVILTPYSSTALAVGDHKLTVSGVKDYAGFTSLNSTHDFTVVEDLVAPTITEATATLESVTLTFSEDVDPSTVVASKVYWKSGDSKKTASGDVEALADNKYKFYFSTANTLPTGTVDIHVEGVKDYSGNELAKDTKVSVKPEIDQTRPEVRKVSVNNAAATEIKVTFSKAINADSVTVLGNYTVTDSKGKVVSVSDAKLDPNDSKSVIVSLYRGLTVGENEITVKNIKDATKLQNTMLDYTGKIAKADGVAPEFVSAVNQRDRQVVLSFDKKMNIDTLTNYSNYLVRIDGTLQTLTPALADISVLQDSKVVIITFAETISDKEVVLNSGNAASGSGKTNVNDLTVLGLKDVAGNLLKQFTDNGQPIAGGGTVTNVIQLNATTLVNLKDFDNANNPGKKAELVDAKTIEVKFDTGINSAETGAFVAKVNGSVVAIDSVIVDGSSTVTLKFKEALKTDAAGLTIDVDYTKLVNIAGGKGVNPVVAGVVTLNQIVPGVSGNLLDSVAPNPVFATGETEYHVSGNTIVITYSENLQELVGNNQDLIDTDFTVTRVSNNKKLNPIGEFDANVVGNTIVITLADTRDVATAYTVSVTGAKYFADASGNEIANSTGKSKSVASSGTQTLAAAKAAAVIATTDAGTAKTAHTTAGGLAVDAEYAAVDAAITALNTVVALNVTADIVTATTTLTTATTALKAKTTDLGTAAAALVTAKANAATAKSAATSALLAYITTGGGAVGDAKYTAVTDAITALDAAVLTNVAASIVTATTTLGTATAAL